MFNEYLVKEDSGKELDWDVEEVLRAYPDIASSTRDDADQKLIDSAITPYIYKELCDDFRARRCWEIHIATSVETLDAKRAKDKGSILEIVFALSVINILLTFFINII